LEQFALDHHLGEFDQRVKDAEVPFLHRDLERLHVKPISGQHALGISPLRIGRGSPAPGLGFVNNVIVNKRRCMDDFDYRTEAHCPSALVIEQFRRKQQQGRADSLAPAGAQILTNLGDGTNARDCIPPEFVFQSDEIVSEEIEYFLPVNGGGRAQV
jgi:hypothetical protein